MNQTKEMSALARSALALDDDFNHLERLGGELDRLDIETDNGLDRARLLLGKFGEAGLRIGDQMQALAKALEESRGRAEKIAEGVAKRAAAIQERHNKAEQMLARFQSLGEMVKKVTEATGRLQPAPGTGFSEDERKLLLERLPELNSQLGVLIEEALRLKTDATAHNMKSLERNADSLAQTLQSVQRKLNSVGT